MDFPPLREELVLLLGAPLPDGQPGHMLHDPVRNLYFQIDWPTFEILCRWTLGYADLIAQAINQETTLYLDVGQVTSVLQFLAYNQLLQPPPGGAPELTQRLRASRGTWAQWLLHNYLFFRVPLVKPDRWLARWVDCVRFIHSPRFLRLSLLALAVGLLEVYRDWDSFAATLVDTFTWSGMTYYGITIVVVKILHELGHGLTAKRFGCRVPAMGVAFLVLWPVAYTDTNDVWKLRNRKQRLQVAAAGVATELLIAAWATLAWAILPEGVPKTVAFLLATTTWAMSVVVNASPFMRFDGYFVLSDWLDMPNLHSRAFALARWDLRERLFALGDPVPEIFSKRQHVGLILFAYATWLYRLGLFLGIAALVYTFFIKVIGILLFVVEMGWFVLGPLYQEIRVWYARRAALRRNRRAKLAAMVAIGLLLVFVIPWPGRIAAPALMRSARQFVVYAPAHAQVQSLPFGNGMAVKSGDVLLNLSSPDMISRSRATAAKMDRLRWQSSTGAFDTDQKAQLQVTNEQLATAEAEWSSIEADNARYHPSAPFDGIWYAADPDLRTSAWVSQQEILGKLVADGRRQVVTYLEEDEISRVSVGDTAIFYTNILAGELPSFEVESIEPDTTHVLQEAELSASFGGTILVRERKGLLYPERAIYRVILRSKSSTRTFDGHSWRGKIVIAGNWSPPGQRFLRAALNLFWREAGF